MNFPGFSKNHSAQGDNWSFLGGGGTSRGSLGLSVPRFNGEGFTLKCHGSLSSTIGATYIHDRKALIVRAFANFQALECMYAWAWDRIFIYHFSFPLHECHQPPDCLTTFIVHHLMAEIDQVVFPGFKLVFMQEVSEGSIGHQRQMLASIGEDVSQF